MGEEESSCTSSPTCLINDNDTAVVFSFLAPRKNCFLPRESQRLILAESLNQQNITEGELMDTLEERAMFPMIHRSKQLLLNSEPLKEIKPMKSDASKGFVFQQGVYMESRYYQTSRKDYNNSISTYIFMGFKSLDSEVNESLIKTWKHWTGARVIYAFLKQDVTVARYSFFHRIMPPDPDLFMYILMVECHNVDGVNKMHLLDFVQRLRVERVFGYLTVYRSNGLTPTSEFLKHEINENDEFVAKVEVH